MPAELKKKLEETEATVATLKSEKSALEAEIVTLKAAPKAGDKCPTCGAVKKEADGIDKSALPEAVRKQLETQEQDIKKQAEDIAKMKDEGLTREYVAKAVEVGAIGKSDEIGTLLKDIAKHDSALAVKVFDVLKGADTKIRTGGLFTELGKEEGKGGASAYDMIVQKASELRKTCPELSEAQAFTKVYDTDHDLRNQHLAETRKSK